MSLVDAMADEPPMAAHGLSMDSDVTDFWKVLATRSSRSGKNDEICDGIAEYLKEDLCFSVKQMFTQTTSQFEQRVLKSGGKTTWTPMVEQFCDATFASGVADAAVDLAKAQRGTAAREAARDVSLGAALKAAGRLREVVLPEYIFDGVEDCDDPREQEITHEDEKRVMNRLWEWHVVTMRRSVMQFCASGMRSSTPTGNAQHLGRAVACPVRRRT